VGPDYVRPSPLAETAVPSAFSEAAPTNTVSWQAAAPSAHLPRGSWWRLFADADLNRIEDLAAAGNQDLAAATARFEKARAQVNVTRADLFPQVELDPSYSRQRTSFNAPENGVATKLSPTYNTFTAQLQAGWEADVWGRVRRQVESARAQLAASADDLESVRLGVQAEVAMDFFTLRSLDAECALLERSAGAFRRSLELTVNRRKGGVASDLDVSQAETQLKSTEAALPPLRLQRTRLIHALAALCGREARGFELAPASPAQAEPPTVPLLVPSALLERRPDIAAAERRMASANAQVGVSRSAFYPHLRVNGLAGFESVDASSWFDWPSRLWSVGPSLELPLFTGGRNRAALAYSRAAYDETVASYRQIVLAAFQEVEDQLAAQRWLQEQLTAEQAALMAAQHTLDIANNRYKSGLVTYLEVATAQSSALDFERLVVQLRGEKLTAAVGLIKALGGGWEAALATSHLAVSGPGGSGLAAPADCW
jgi:multidrug efflux system outer membrane protein